MNHLISSILFVAFLVGCSDVATNAPADDAPPVQVSDQVKPEPEAEPDTYPQELLHKARVMLSKSGAHVAKLGLSAQLTASMMRDEKTHIRSEYRRIMKAKGYDDELIDSFACKIG